MQWNLPALGLEKPWKQQRADWISLAEEYLYGHAPNDPGMRSETVRVEPLWEGRGVREVLRVFYGPGLQFSFDAVLLRPADEEPHPAITWNQFTPEDPSPLAEEAVVLRGFCIAAFDKLQLAQDEQPGRLDAYRAYPDCDWGAIRIWAWGHQKLADALVGRADIRADQLACTGFSRGGKAALAAGIFDERFRVCAPINAGAGGCGCFRWLGDRNGLNQDVNRVESLGRVYSAFPHWWVRRMGDFVGIPLPDQMGREGEFPLDSHVLKALIAPRWLISSEGIDDAWSNPFGTALTWLAAQPAFDRLGGSNGIFYRPGGHAFGEEDWRAVLDFCDEAFRGRNTGRTWDRQPYAELARE